MPQPPCQSFASRQLAWLFPASAAGTSAGAWVAALAIAAGLVAFQYVAPPATSVILPLLLLTAFAVSFLGTRRGTALALLTVLAGGVATHVGIGMAHYLGAAHAYIWRLCLWNLLSHLGSVSLMAFVLAGLRRGLEVERWRASIDHLTGVLNRGAFEERLGQTVRRAERRGQALVLAFMDLDGFKGVNDRHGHAAGNKVLTAFAQTGAGAIRPEDLFARIGGDEFAALLTVPSCVEGDRVAELLHRRLSLILGGTGFDVTCSMGALVMEARAMAREGDVLEQADRLMYVAKSSGKNALHIGRGEALEAILRSAFPVDQTPPPAAMTGLLRWADHAERSSRRNA